MLDALILGVSLFAIPVLIGIVLFLLGKGLLSIFFE